MDASFWRERWAQGQTGFHRAEVNALLVQHWAGLGVPRDRQVLVPLCGKSLDMHWLRSRGHPVLGVEVSDIAVKQFFQEAGIRPETHRSGAFDVSEGGGIALLCGDFFELDRDAVRHVRGVYDRAAFVALPPDWRRRYARHLCDLLPPGAPVLMIAFEYEARDFTGPPFSIAEEEVRGLYGDAFRVEVAERSGPHPAPPHLAERGLEAFVDSVYRLVP